MNFRRVICLGGANIDVKLKANQRFYDGDSNPVTSLRTTGGVARNIAESLARLGLPVSLISRVGSDPEGKALLTELNDLGIDIEGVSESSRCSTATYTALLEPDGNLFVATADMGIYDEITPELLSEYSSKIRDGTWIIIDSNFPVESMQSFLEGLGSQCRVWAVPVSASKVTRFKPLLPFLSGLILNQKELAALSGCCISNMKEMKEACEELMRQGVPSVVVTRGSHGVFLMSPEGSSAVLVQKKEHYSDVTGAGDSFASGVFYGLQQGKDLRSAVTYGIAAANLTLETEKSVSPDLNLFQLLSKLEPARDAVKEPV